ncbi:MAG: hypothetical protein QF685_00475 [Verrucomicrobiota bacterium]|jgi:hypothetical protein|nr:hypothetical protein [Verrucomicrobiota bacterium]
MKDSLTILFIFTFICLSAAPPTLKNTTPTRREVPDGPTRILAELFKGDANRDGKISSQEFNLPAALFVSFDANKDGFVTAREIKALLPRSTAELKGLWSYGLISRRTGSPLIEPGGEHKMDRRKVSYGYNVVVDRDGETVRPGGRPLRGGERLKLTKEYQKDKNVRELARVYTIMAPIRDAILYEFENTSRKEWLKLTKVLAINNIKTTKATTIGPRSILSCEQVYDYVTRGPRVGSPVMRFLEEAELELKCLAFVDVKIPAAAAAMARHSKEHNIDAGSGIKLP